MEFTTKNGVQVQIDSADFLTSLRLKNVVLKAVKESGVDIAKIDLNDLKASSLNPIAQAVLSVDTSPEVEETIFKCLVRCKYKSEKITRETFEDKEARMDYYEIIIACLKENLSPFFATLISKLSDLQVAKESEIQK